MIIKSIGRDFSLPKTFVNKEIKDYIYGSNSSVPNYG